MISAVARGLAAPAAAAFCLAAAPSWSAEKVDADWVQKPSGEEFAAAFPPIANALGIEGRVILACAITANGVLTECVAQTETPKGLGFGEAALMMTPSFRMRPTTVGGRAKGGDTVRIPIHFKLPPPPPEVQPGPPTSPRALEIARSLTAAEGLRERVVSHYGAHNGDRNLWRRRGVAEATLNAGIAAQQKALEVVAPAWVEMAARTYAALFDEAQLTAALAYAESPDGHTALRKSAQFDALGGPLAWVTFRRGLSAARDIFCQDHECLPKAGASPASQQPAILTPDWLEQPGRWQIFRATPFLARALSVPGEARLGCKVTGLGLLYECRVQYETPRALGFGPSAIELAKLYRAQPLPPGATATPPTVEFVIRFPELPAVPPPFAPLPTLDPEPGEVRLSLGRQIVAVADLRAEAMKANTQNMEGFDKIPSPGVDPETRAEARTALSTGLDQAVGFFEVERAKHYAGLFSEAELRGMLAWELSPAGKARRAELTRLVELAVEMDKNFDTEVSRQAGAIFCASRDCTTTIVVPKP